MLPTVAAFVGAAAAGGASVHVYHSKTPQRKSGRKSQAVSFEQETTQQQQRLSATATSSTAPARLPFMAQRASARGTVVDVDGEPVVAGGEPGGGGIIPSRAALLLTGAISFSLAMGVNRFLNGPDQSAEKPPRTPASRLKNFNDKFRGGVDVQSAAAVEAEAGGGGSRNSMRQGLH